MNPLDPSMSLQRRCMSCGNKLFPYSGQDAEDWAVWAYYQCQKRNVFSKSFDVRKSTQHR